MHLKKVLHKQMQIAPSLAHELIVNFDKSSSTQTCVMALVQSVCRLFSLCVCTFFMRRRQRQSIGKYVVSGIKCLYDEELFT